MHIKQTRLAMYAVFVPRLWLQWQVCEPVSHFNTEWFGKSLVQTGFAFCGPISPFNSSQDFIPLLLPFWNPVFAPLGKYHQYVQFHQLLKTSTLPLCPHLSLTRQVQLLCWCIWHFTLGFGEIWKPYEHTTLCQPSLSFTTEFLVIPTGALLTSERFFPPEEMSYHRTNRIFFPGNS